MNYSQHIRTLIMNPHTTLCHRRTRVQQGYSRVMVLLRAPYVAGMEMVLEPIMKIEL